MIIYQVIANLLFDSEDEARDFYHDCEVALPKSTVINSDQANIEFGTIQLVENHHAQEPLAPCGIIQEQTNH